MATKPKTTEAKTAPKISAVVNILLPARKTNRGGAAVYPFDTLANVGDIFGVSDRNKKSIQSAVSNQNRKFKQQRKGADGNVILDGKGKPTTEYTRHFEVIEVDADIAAAIKGTPLEGSKVLVRRDK